MFGRITTVLVGCFVAALAASSCAGKGDCRYNSDCVGAYCAAGVCKKDCVDATVDCKRGEVCNAVAQCEAPGASAPDGGGGPPAGGSLAAVTRRPSNGPLLLVRLRAQPVETLRQPPEPRRRSAMVLDAPPPAIATGLTCTARTYRTDRFGPWRRRRDIASLPPYTRFRRTGSA